MSITTKNPQSAATPKIMNQERDVTEEQRRQRQVALNQPTIALLRSWIEEEQDDSDEEQREALAWLMDAIDEDRPSDRKLFS